MYGLLQAGRATYDCLCIHLSTYIYALCSLAPDLWKHSHCHITFTIVVGNCGIHTVDQEHTEHLTNPLRDLYTVTIDLTGSIYRGMILNWNYARGYVDLSMHGYVEHALHKFYYSIPT